MSSEEILERLAKRRGVKAAIAERKRRIYELRMIILNDLDAKESEAQRNFRRWTLRRLLDCEISERRS